MLYCIIINRCVIGRRKGDVMERMSDYDADRIRSREKRCRQLAAPAYDWISAMIVALTVLVLLFTFCFRIVGVDGESMVPSLNDGDRLVLVSTGHTYTAGDVVVVDRYTKEPLIKRVIAVAGDTINIRPDYTVILNGQVLDEPYIQGSTVLRDFSGPLTIPEGYLFVMGDNRSVSLDSRSAEVGLVSVKDVVGVARLRIWPLKQFGAICKD